MLFPPALSVVHVTVTRLEVNVVDLLDAAHFGGAHVSPDAASAVLAIIPNARSAPANRPTNILNLVFRITLPH
jgi:hypothetical protein